MTKPVAIIGQAFRFPSTDAGHFWDDMLAGRDLVSQVPADRWTHQAFLHPDKKHPGSAYTFAAGTIGDVSQFDPAFFGISPREAAQMDPQQRLLLELAYEAITDAGYSMEQLRGSDTGVFIGIASADYSYRLADDMSLIDSAIATGNTASIAANRLSYVYDLRGPSMAIDTACSSSLVAFHQAVRAIQTGDSDMALCGGVSLHLHPYGFIIFSKASMLSPTGRCQVFDAGGDGYVRSEGGGLFLLKDYAKAVADGDNILAVVAASAVNTDGRKSGLTVPSCKAQQALLEKVYREAGIDIAEIDYIEAHGTGTSVGDPIETRALGLAIGSKRPTKQPLLIGSVKSNLGHLEAASGVAGLVKAIYSLRHRVVPATIGIRQLNPAIDFSGGNLQVVQENQPLKPNGTLTIGVNSFGFGGSNAHVILQSAPVAAPRSIPEHATLPMVISAVQQDGLQANAQHHLMFLQQMPAANWYSACYQSVFRRDWFKERLLVWGDDPQQAAQALQSYLEQGQHPAVTALTATKASSASVWVYSGNGCQWHAMGRELLQDPVFSACINDIDQIFQPLAGYSLRDELAGELGSDRVDATEFAQPALFALQVGITSVLRAAGLKPKAVVGHSVGEVAAAWAAGILSLAQACQVIFHRSRLQGQTRGNGQMTAAAISAAQATSLINELALADHLVIAGVNSASGVTLAGSPDALTQLEQHLQAERIFCRRLPLDYAFHSPAMDPIRHELAEVLQTLAPATGQLDFYSTVYGRKTPGTELTADYWWLNIREPVQFHAAVSALIKDGYLLMAEIGGHPVLRGYLQEALKDSSGLVFESVRRQQADINQLHRLRNQLLLSRQDTDWQQYFPLEPAQYKLPAYQWQYQRCWLDYDTEALGSLYRPSLHPLLGAAMPPHKNCWQQKIDTYLLPWLSEHQVGNAIVFPGSGFVELALACAAEQCPNGPLVLEDLEIQAPLLVESQQSRLLRTELNEQDGSVRFSSRAQLSAPQLQQHSQCRILLQADLAVAAPTAPQIPASAADFSRQDQDAATELLDLQYGDHFRQVAQGWRQGQTVLALLAQPDGSACDYPAYLLHPGVLDSTFQLIIQALYPKVTDGFTYIPVSIRRIELYQRKSIPHLAELTVLRHSPFSILADFCLFDQSGQAVARLSGARFKRVRLNNQRRTPQLWHQICRPDAIMPTTLPALPDFLTLQRDQLRQELDPLLNELMRRSLQEHLQPYQQQWPDFIALLRLRHEPAALWLEQMLANTALQPEDFSAEQADGLTAGELWRALLVGYPAYTPLLQLTGQLLNNWPAILDGQALWRPEVPAMLEVMHNRTNALVPELVSILQQWAQQAARPLHLLEYSPEHPHLCTELLQQPASGLQLGFASAETSADAQMLAEHYPELQLLQEQAQYKADLLWFWPEYADTATAVQALQKALTLLQPGGCLLLPLQQQGFWSALMLDPAHPCVPLLQSAFWLEQLHDYDTQVHPLPQAGLDLIEVRIPLSAAVNTAELPAVVLLDAACKAVTGLPVLAQGTTSQPDVVATGWPAGTQLVWQANPVRGSALEQAEQACRQLLELHRWATRHAPDSPIWLCIPDASLYSCATPSPASVALWGMARTLRNEHSATVYLLDHPADSAISALLAAEMRQESRATEVHYDNNGVRYTPQVEAIPLPRHLPDYRLEINQPGQLKHLQWRQMTLPALAADEIAVEVRATGLNFRDVMYALGLLSDEALEQGFAGPTLGLEFAGVVQQVGSKVAGFRPGDRVLGFGPASFASKVITKASAAALLPETIDYAAGATIPSTFFTAYYALHQLAQLEANETILIHGAAGGVGIAAIQIARWKGARIIATAGSAAKHAFLRQLGVQDILDSRSLKFADEVLTLTNGQGVDVVLNSLAGEAVNRNLKILKPFGRFLELGKRDFYENSKIGLRPFRNNISYFGIDADQMMSCRPAMTSRLFADMMQLFADGILWPLPFQTFSAVQIEAAFRQMQQARHIGKIVVEYPAQLPVIPETVPMSLAPELCYVVTGGMTGFGLATAKALVKAGACRLLLLNRRGADSPDAAAVLQDFVADGVQVLCPACDVSNKQALDKALTQARLSLGPIGGVIHAAAVIEDSLLLNLADQTLHQVLAAKLQGAWWLDELTEQDALKFFVLYSSATTLFGNPGQGAYVAANYGLEMLAQQRRARGLPATALLWGAIEDAGFLARNTEIKAALQQRMGGQTITTAEAMTALQQVLVLGQTEAAVLDLEFSALQKFLPAAQDQRFSRLAANQEPLSAEGNSQDLRELLAAMSVSAAEQYLTDALRQVVATILRANPEKMSVNVPLQELGLDSLMGVELVVAIEQKLGIRLPVLSVSEQPTLQGLAEKILAQMNSGTETDSLTEQIRQVSGSHGANLSQQELASIQQQLTQTPQRRLISDQ